MRSGTSDAGADAAVAATVSSLMGAALIPSIDPSRGVGGAPLGAAVRLTAFGSLAKRVAAGDAFADGTGAWRGETSKVTGTPRGAGWVNTVDR